MLTASRRDFLRSLLLASGLMLTKPLELLKPKPIAFVEEWIPIEASIVSEVTPDGGYVVTFDLAQEIERDLVKITKQWDRELFGDAVERDVIEGSSDLVGDPRGILRFGEIG